MRGAYSLLFLTLDRMIAARDPMGFRPLVVGRFNSGPNEGAYVVASETCALDLIEANYEREVEPGEIITLSANGMESSSLFRPRRKLNAFSSTSILLVPTAISTVTTSIKCARLSAGSWPAKAPWTRIS